MPVLFSESFLRCRRKTQPEICVPLQRLRSRFDKGPRVLIAGRNREIRIQDEASERRDIVTVLQGKSVGIGFFFSVGAVELIVQYMIEIAGHIEYPISDAPQLITAA